MIDFGQIVRESRPKLRDTSVAAYAMSLKTLAPPDAGSLEFLKDTDAVLSRLDGYKPNTRKNHLNAAVVVLQNSDDPEFTAAVKTYERRRDKYQEEYLDQVKAHKKTPSQEANWIEWPEYEAMVTRLSKDVQWTGEVTKSQEMKFQDYLITLLHKNFPVRNDFADLRVVTRSQWLAMDDAEQTGHNYYVHGQTFHRFVLNNYKTSAKYGQRVLEVEDKELLRALRRWLRINQSAHFLRNRKEAALNSNGITKVLGRVGQREEGKALGSSILRHSYLSHKYQGVDEEKKKDAALMMHSVATQGDYVKTED